MNIPVQEDVAVAEAEFELDEDFDVEEETEELLVFVESVVAIVEDTLDELEVPVPGTH